MHNIAPGPLVKWGNTGRLSCNAVDRRVLLVDIAEGLSLDEDELEGRATDVDVDCATVFDVVTVEGLSFDVDEFVGERTDVDVNGRLGVEEVGVESLIGREEDVGLNA